MKIIRDIQQTSWEWFVRRAGKITGSELGNLISDKGKLRGWSTGMPNSYLHRKLAEKWRGGPLETFTGSRQTDQGQMYEEQARSYFAALLDADIETVGGLESDDGRLWCSPDGIIGEGHGLEIKSPNADTHVGWLLAGQQVPEEHVLQVQFSLFVSGWDKWTFLSYCKDMPHLAVTVEPDDDLMPVMQEAVDEFQDRFDAAWQRLCDLNGGPPVAKAPVEPNPAFGPVRFSWEQQDNEVPIP